MTELNYSDRTDFANADRGFVAGPQQPTITTADGRVVWDFDSTKFLDGDCPDGVNPSLWRQSQLVARAGLYQVADGVYQIRGFDLSNMTLIEGDTGVIVVDPLVSAETAAAGLALYRAERGEKPVTGVIFTHSHLDHFGGIHGVLDGGASGGASADVPLVAPEHFMVESVAENVYAGTAMLRRGIYYAGSNLERGPQGLVSMGLGFTASTGNPGLLPPTITITKTGQQESIDGVRIVFQITPGTEAPSEMNFFLPDRRALCMAENATHNLHNILTLRGALVRDTHIWARYLGEAIALFADESDVLFASHHWPTWGTAEIKTFLSQQRDLYAYLHDQTLRLLNQGYTGPEIAELIELPPVLQTAWHARDYYGSISHNVKAIYQRYMGWYDGNPASLWEHPPTETAKRYAECFGGADQIVAKARGYADDGDLRFAAQLLKHAVFAEPDNTEAKNLLADVFEKLGRGAECATWRNCYLTGAAELRTGIKPTVIAAGSMTAALSIPQFFDSLAIRVNGPKAWDAHAVADWHFTDLDERYRLTLENGVLTYVSLGSTPTEEADAAFTLTKPQFMGLLAGKGIDGIQHTGDATVLTTVMGVLDDPDPNFAIVTP